MQLVPLIYSFLVLAWIDSILLVSIPQPLFINDSFAIIFCQMSITLCQYESKASLTTINGTVKELVINLVEVSVVFKPHICLAILKFWPTSMPGSWPQLKLALFNVSPAIGSGWICHIQLLTLKQVKEVECPLYSQIKTFHCTWKANKSSNPFQFSVIQLHCQYNYQKNRLTVCHHGRCFI